MRAQRFDVILEQLLALSALLAGGVGGNLAGFEICRKRHLGVHQDGATAGKANGHVRANLAALGARGLLRGEVDEFEQTGHLNDAAQLRLAPLTLDVVGAQRAGQRFRGGAQFVARASAVGELLRDEAVLLLLFVLHGVDLDGHLVQHLFDRREFGNHAGIPLLLIDQVFVALRERINLGLALHAHGFRLSQTHTERRIAVLGRP